MSYCGMVTHEMTIEVLSSGQMAKWLIEDVLNIEFNCRLRRKHYF